METSLFECQRHFIVSFGFAADVSCTIEPSRCIAGDSAKGAKLVVEDAVIFASLLQKSHLVADFQSQTPSFLSCWLRKRAHFTFNTLLLILHSAISRGASKRLITNENQARCCGGRRNREPGTGWGSKWGLMTNWCRLKAHFSLKLMFDNMVKSQYFWFSLGANRRDAAVAAASLGPRVHTGGAAETPGGHRPQLHSFLRLATSIKGKERIELRFSGWNESLLTFKRTIFWSTDTCHNRSAIDFQTNELMKLD